ncbi:hypothetical protein LWI29_011746 [Acer saccharum]|uniref:Ammonium transporter n=1 Tax=Acer saccharum TaxID=4024 RepID=A0AA39VME8_ACESA|nr:hypothetical protein LWI29_011746 [Acer saccharum]
MPEEQLVIGDDAVHGEEAYGLWGDGEKYDPRKHGLHSTSPLYAEDVAPSPYINGARGDRQDLPSFPTLFPYRSWSGMGSTNNGHSFYTVMRLSNKLPLLKIGDSAVHGEEKPMF